MLLTRFTLILLSFVLYTNVAYAQSEKLVVFNWAHYLSEQVATEFEQQHGIEIEQVYFDDVSQRDRTINNIAAGQIDIVVLDEVAAENFQRSGKIIELPQYDLPFMNQIPELWQSQCTTAGVPYFWGTLGLAYRKDIFDSPPTSWNAILNAEPNIKGHILMMSDFTDMLMPSLFKQGLTLSQATPEDLKGVYKELIGVVPDVLDFAYILSYFEQNTKARDDVYIAMAYSGDERSLNQIDSRYEWGFVTPTEGTVVWVDCLAVLTSSKQKNQAIRFLEFLNQPDVSAENAQHLGNNPTNSVAFSIVNSRLDTATQSTPSLDQLSQATYYNDNVQISVTLRNRIAYAVMDAHHKYHTKNN